MQSAHGPVVCRASLYPQAHRGAGLPALRAPAEPDSIQQPADWESRAIELGILLDEFQPRFNRKLAEVIHAARAAGMTLRAEEVLGTFANLSIAVSDLGVED
jgi:hypothetical protein